MYLPVGFLLAEAGYLARRNPDVPLLSRRQVHLLALSVSYQMDKSGPMALRTPSHSTSRMAAL